LLHAEISECRIQQEAEGMEETKNDPNTKMTNLQYLYQYEILCLFVMRSNWMAADSQLKAIKNSYPDKVQVDHHIIKEMEEYINHNLFFEKKQEIIHRSICKSLGIDLNEKHWLDSDYLKKDTSMYGENLLLNEVQEPIVIEQRNDEPENIYYRNVVSEDSIEEKNKIVEEDNFPRINSYDHQKREERRFQKISEKAKKYTEKNESKTLEIIEEGMDLIDDMDVDRQNFRNKYRMPKSMLQVKFLHELNIKINFKDKNNQKKKVVVLYPITGCINVVSRTIRIKREKILDTLLRGKSVLEVDYEVPVKLRSSQVDLVYEGNVKQYLNNTFTFSGSEKWLYPAIQKGQWYFDPTIDMDVIQELERYWAQRKERYARIRAGKKD
jgi:hypothetical protein